MKKMLTVLLLVLIGALTSAQAQTANVKPKVNVAILIFEGVQIIDYTGPYEVLGGWGKRHVYTVAEKADPITTAMGMRVIPNYTFDNQPQPDVIIIPGGGESSPGEKARGVGGQLENERVIKWIQDNSKQARYVMSVCNGAFLLAKAGVLDGLEATTTAGLVERLRKVAPKTKVVSDRRFVDNGKIITTGGLSSGIDGALHLIEKMDGKGWAQMVAYGIEYDWRPESGYARAAHADLKLPGSIYEAFYPGAEPLSFKGGAEAWEEKWDVSSVSSPGDLLQRIGEKWAADTKWTKASVEKAGGAASNTSRWRFVDEKGQAWDAAASVEPAGEEKRLVLTLTIARVNGAKAELR
ncbi:MAG TPA: DJ-1/PfpI family protein [Pyrinomonadaceae bacterium]|nr:DJ-1/PfpI family protein [Pyrinomonadaceae bacterium]